MLYYRIKENVLYDFASYKYFADCQETDIITEQELKEHPNKVVVALVEEEIEVPDYDPEMGEQTGTHTEIVTVQKLVLNPNWDEEQYIRREREFKNAFFNTSLGYVRRAVTMADGSHKDFLSDLLPVISMGVQGGMPVNILTYDMPPFDEDVTDWTEYQHQVVVTPQFIQECFLQLSADFAPINNEE